MGATTPMGELPCLVDLVAVLFECFLIISLGYLSGRFKVVSSQAKDLNSYLTTFALPSIIFLNIAQMEFQTINLSFLICMLTAKLLVFTTVTLITLSISYPKNSGMAGALSILATQSNDFALGYPLIKSLYGDSKPEMLNYLSLMAPIQLLILNPLGIAMLEYNRSKKQAQELRTKPADCGNLEVYETSFQSGGLDTLPACYDNPPAIRSSTPTSQQRGSMGALQTYAKHVDATSSINTTSRSRHGWDQQRPQSALAMSSDYDRAAHNSGYRSLNMRLMTLVMPPGSNQSHRATSLEALNMANGLNAEDPDAQHNDDEASAESVDFFAHQQSLSSKKVTRDSDLISQNSGATSLSQRSNRVSTISQSPLEIDVTMSDCCHDGRQETPTNSRSQVDDGLVSHNDQPSARMDLNFLKALATNPLIIASIVALLVNLIHGPSLPKFVTRVSSTIAASFASPALFVVGLSMYGKFDLLKKNPSDLLLSSVLVLTKILILPNLMRTLALIVLPFQTPAEEFHYLVDFSFLYGMLPTAPTACIIANQYGVLTDVVSLSMLLSTIFSVPLIMASSTIINPTSTIRPSVYDDITSEVTKISSVITLSLASLTLYAFWKSSKQLKYPNFIDHQNHINGAKKILDKIKSNPVHIFLVLLVLGQTMIGLGGMAWYFEDNSRSNPDIDPVMTTISPVSSLETTTMANSAIIQEPNDMMPAPASKEILDTGPAANGPMLETEITTDPSTRSNPDQPSIFRQERSIGSTVMSGDILTSMGNLVGGKTTDASTHYLKVFQYISSSYGLLMVKCFTLCLLISIVTMKLMSRHSKLNVPALMVKASIFFGTVILVWLAFDSQQLGHLPSEASLPSQKRSLWVRLFFNIVFLSASVPMFVFIIRSYNRSMVNRENKRRAKLLSSERSQSNGTKSSPATPTNLAKSHFVLSSASLSSDASSALTCNTNLDSNAGFHHVNPPDFSINPLYRVQNDCPLATVISGNGILESLEHEQEARADCGLDVERTNQVPSTHIEERSIKVRSDDNCDQNNNQIYELDDPTNEERNVSFQKCTPFLTSTEFNKCSLLILFVLINSTHHLASLCQKLLQPDPIGTFRHVEIVNAALEFGQGFLTFLIYGTKGLLK